jgi:hypothetical protein
MPESLQQEAGTETVWDVAWREGYAKALEATLGVNYKRAHPLAREFWRPRDTRQIRLARWLFRRNLP